MTDASFVDIATASLAGAAVADALGGAAEGNTPENRAALVAQMRDGSGAATGTTNWSAPNIPLQSGANVITVTVQDASGRC